MKTRRTSALLAIFPVIVALCSASVMATEGEAWQVQITERDEDGAATLAFLARDARAADGTELVGTPRLLVRCEGGEASVFLDLGAGQSLRGRSPERPVKLGFGDARPSKAELLADESGRVNRLNPPLFPLHRFVNESRISFAYRLEDRQKQRIIVELDGLAEAARSVESACYGDSSPSVAIWKPGDPPLPEGTPHITEPELLKGVAPDYPRELRSRRIEGRAILHVTILEDGTVDRHGITLKQETPPGSGFGKEAINAVSQWRYHPARYEGKPVAVLITVVISFTLD